MKKKHWSIGYRGLAIMLVLAMIFTMIPVQELRAETKSSTQTVKTSGVTLQNPRIVEDSSMEAG